MLQSGTKKIESILVTNDMKPYPSCSASWPWKHEKNNIQKILVNARVFFRSTTIQAKVN